MSETIFIFWKETEREFSRWRQGAIGTGILEPVFVEKEVTRRVRFSTENTAERMQQAKEYLEFSRPEGWIEVIEE